MISWASEEYPFDNHEFAKRFTEEFMRDYFRLPDVVKTCKEVTQFYKEGQPTRCMMATYDTAVMEEHFLLMGDFDHKKTAAKIVCPCLVVTGGGDDLMPKKWVKELSSHILNSTYVEIPGAGHAAGIFYAEEIAIEIMSFVNRHKRAGLQV